MNGVEGLCSRIKIIPLEVQDLMISVAFLKCFCVTPASGMSASAQEGCVCPARQLPTWPLPQEQWQFQPAEGEVSTTLEF